MNLYTSSQLAAAVGRKRQWVQWCLRDVPVSGFCAVNGNEAKAWCLESLPAVLLQELRGIAAARGYRDADELLRSPAAPELLPARDCEAETEAMDLARIAELFKDSQSPYFEDRAALWFHVFEAFELDQADGMSAKQSRVRLLEWLTVNASGLAASREALRKAWDYNWARYSGAQCPVERMAAELAKGWSREAVVRRVRLEALRDQRRNNGRPSIALFTPEDKNKLVGAAAKFESLARGWKECLTQEALSTDVILTYGHLEEPPRVVRDELAPRIAMEVDALHGPNRVRSNGPYVNRVPHSAAGDWDQSDDRTFNHIVTEETPAGLYCDQPQLLVWLDQRSWFIYNFILISDRGYSGFDIRNSWTTKAADWGLPRKGLALELGIWKTAKLIAGRRAEIDPLETEKGLRDFGLQFRNYTHARGKIIETVFRLTQRDLRPLPGYVGRNPLTDKFQEVYEQRQLVKSGKAKASDFFKSKAWWMEALGQVFHQFNQTPLKGKYHGGKTPEQVLQEKWSTPVIKVPDECRHVLATHRIGPVKIGRNGLSFVYGKQRFTYKNYETGRRRHEWVIAKFNPAQPQFLTVVDKNGENPFVVAREPEVYDHDPEPGTLEQAYRDNAAHARYQKEQHRSLKAFYKSNFFTTGMFRMNIVDPAIVEAGREIKRQETALAAQQRETRKLEAKARNAGARLNYPVAAEPEQIDAAERLSELLGRMKGEERI